MQTGESKGDCVRLVKHNATEREGAILLGVVGPHGGFDRRQGPTFEASSALFSAGRRISVMGIAETEGAAVAPFRGS